jgi:acetyl esterase/lipase
MGMRVANIDAVKNKYEDGPMNAIKIRRRSIAIDPSFLAASLVAAGALLQGSQGSSAMAAEAGEPNTILDKTSAALTKARTDAEMDALLDAHERLNPKAIDELSVQEARHNPTIADAVKAVLQKQGRSAKPEDLVPGVKSVDRTIQGAAGPLPARVYTPDGKGPFPVIVYFHGGGWVIADKDVYDGGARGLERQANAIVLSVDYRLAPEHKFPAAWDDALASYKWALKEAASLNGDPSRIALAGESAGGNLAMATAIAARDAGLPKPAHVLAIYPVTQHSLNTVSYLENAIAKPLNRATVKWFIDKVTRSPDDLKDPRIDLVDARLEGLPTVTIINAHVDPLRNDGIKLERALKDARVPVERRDFEGVTHEFFGAAAVLGKAREAQAYAGQRLKSAFGSSLDEQLTTIGR